MTFEDTPQLADATADQAAPAIRGRGYYWTTVEVEFLRQNYPKIGAVGCAKHLQDRALSAIHGKAQLLKLRAPRNRPGKRTPKLYPTSPQLDAQIRAVYAAARAKGDVKAFADKMNLPAWWVQKRAVRLGVSRSVRDRADRWKPAEVKILETYASCSEIYIAAKLREAGFSRTPTAVRSMLKRHQHIDRLDPDQWTTAELAELMGVQPNAVAKWVADRGLKPAPEAYGPKGTMVFSRKAVTAFVKRNRNLVNLRRVDAIWFLDLAFGPA